MFEVEAGLDRFAFGVEACLTTGKGDGAELPAAIIGAEEEVLTLSFSCAETARTVEKKAEYHNKQAGYLIPGDMGLC